MKNRRIANMQDFRDLVLGTLGQFVPEHDTDGIAEHLYQAAQTDGASYHSRILDQGDDDLVMVDDFWAVARLYHHPTVQAGGPAGRFYEPAEPVTPTPTEPAQTPARARVSP